MVYCRECRHSGARAGDASTMCFEVKEVGYENTPEKRKKYVVNPVPHIDNQNNDCKYYQEKRLIDSIPFLDKRHWII